MNLIIDNQRDLIIAVISLVGQIEKKELFDMFPGAYRSVETHYLSLKKERIVRDIRVNEEVLSVSNNCNAALGSHGREAYVLGMLKYNNKLTEPQLLKLLPSDDDKFIGLIKRLKKNGKIIITEGRAKTYIRLTKEYGLNEAKRISPYLLQHYQNLTSNHKFGISERYQKRLNQLGSLILYLITNGYEVDFMKIEYTSNNFGSKEKERNKKPKQISFGNNNELYSTEKHLFKEDGELKTLSELIAIIEPWSNYFFTSKAFRNITSNISVNNRNAMYRIYGIFFGGYNYYPTYCISSEQVEWQISVEQSMMNSLETHLRLRWGKDRIYERKEGFKNGSCIAFVKNEETIIKMINLHEAKESKRYIYPPDIYSSSHILMQNKTSSNILKMLLVEKWNIKLMNALFDKETIKKSKTLDADLDIEGRLIWELLSCDLNKIEAIKRWSEVGKKVAVLIHPWQKTLVEKIFKKTLNQINIIEIKEKTFNEIMEEIENEK